MYANGRPLSALVDTRSLAFLLTTHDDLKGPPEGETKRIQATCSFYVFRMQYVPHANVAELLDIPST